MTRPVLANEERQITVGAMPIADEQPEKRLSATALNRTRESPERRRQRLGSPETMVDDGVAGEHDRDLARLPLRPEFEHGDRGKTREHLALAQLDDMVLAGKVRAELCFVAAAVIAAVQRVHLRGLGLADRVPVQDTGSQFFH